MKKIVMIDSSCIQHDEISSHIETYLQNFSEIEVVPFNPDLSSYGKNIICLYVIPKIYNRSQLDVVRTNTNVVHWLLLLEGEENDYGITQLVDNLYVSLSTVRQLHEIKYISNMCDIDEIITELANIGIRESGKWLLISNRRGAGKSTICDLLENKLEIQGEYWCIDSSLFKTKEEFTEEITKYAIDADIVLLIGCLPQDFSIPSIQNITSKLYIVCNKEDTLICEAMDGVIQRKIVQYLNGMGWNLNPEFPVLITSAKYEEYRVLLTTGKLHVNDFNLMENFVMWDSYGLPLKRELYRDENVIKSFLDGFNSIGSTIADAMKKINTSYDYSDIESINCEG